MMNTEKNAIKIIARKTILPILLLFAIWSCSEDFFNEIPSDRIIPGQHYNSWLDAEISAKGTLALLQQIVPQMVLSNELLADLVTVTDNSDFNLKQINTHTCVADNPFINPSVYYQVVISANEALTHIDSIATRDQDITEIDMQILKGSLIGIRSWAYFTVARLYGEAAYFEDNVEKITDDPINYLPMNVMYDTLVNQLKPYLDIDYVEIGNISMYNKALIGEIYLENQQYDSAAFYLQMACEGFENDRYKYKVTRSFQKDSWRELFVNSEGNTSEVMITVPFSATESQENPLEKWYAYDNEYLVKPTINIIDLFNQQTGQRGGQGDEFRGMGVSFDTISQDVYEIKKFDLNEAVSYSSDIILYRAADLHLMFAEALNRMGNWQSALSLVNEGFHEDRNWSRGLGVRGRVYLKNKGFPEGGVTDTLLYVEDIIAEERALELAFEGKRWTDLMRFSRRRGASYLAERVAAKFPEGSEKEQIKQQLKDENNWYLPFNK